MSDYLKEENGFPTRKTAIASTAGAGDADKMIKTGADGLIDPSFLPTSEEANIVCSENLAAGDIVNLWDDSGTVKVRKADASGGIAKKAHGFVRANFTSGATAKVYFEGLNASLSSLTPGATYFLSATAGAVTATPPSSPNISQIVGYARNATTLVFEQQIPIV